MLSFVRVTWIMVSHHSRRTATKTEVGARDCGFAVAGLTVLCVGGTWRTLELEEWLGMVSGAHEPSSGSMEGRAEGGPTCGSPAQGVPEGKDTSNWI